MPVTLLVDGRLFASAIALRVRDGVTFAPLPGVVERIADRASLYDGGRIVLERGDRKVSIAVGRLELPGDAWSLRLTVAPYRESARIWVPLAQIARGLGEATGWNAAAKIISVTMPPTAPVSTPGTPPPRIVVPTELFTPRPVPTPTELATAPAAPRRTPIPYSPARPYELP